VASRHHGRAAPIRVGVTTPPQARLERALLHRLDDFGGMRQPSLFSVARGDTGVHEGAHVFAKVSGSRRISKSKATVLEVGSEFVGKGCDGAAGEDGGQLADLRSVLCRGVSRTRPGRDAFENHRHAEQRKSGMERRKALVFRRPPAGVVALGVSVASGDAERREVKPAKTAIFVGVGDPGQSAEGKIGERMSWEAYPLTSAPGAVLAAVGTDSGFACNAAPVVADLAKWTPTFAAYEFRDETSPPRPYMTTPPSFPLGASHTSDVLYVWQSETTVPLTPEQMALTRIMLGFWSNFAATGDPNGAALPEWPRYEAQSPRRIGFLAGGAVEEVSADAYAQEHHCALWDALAREKAP
jgi:hypothetical protein